MVKSRNDIVITVKRQEETISIRLPPNSELLETGLRVLSENSLDESMSEEGYEAYRYPPWLSDELRADAKFREEFDKVCEEFGVGYYEKHKISNIIEISSEGQKVIIKEKPDEKEWIRFLTSLVDKIEKENVRFVMVHLAGSIKDEEKDKIIDTATRQFIHFPIRRYYSMRNDKTTLMEIFFFGSNVDKALYDRR